jgi:hypothetical protein
MKEKKFPSQSAKDSDISKSPEIFFSNPSQLITDLIKIFDLIDIHNDLENQVKA